MTPTLPQIHTFLSEVREVLLSEGLKEVRDPVRANRLNRLWREAGEMMEGMGWQSIESAPKDGTEVLLWGRCHLRGSFYGADANVGWFEDASNDWRARDLPIKPTHWMPLPEPPGIEDQMKGEG